MDARNLYPSDAMPEDPSCADEPTPDPSTGSLSEGTPGRWPAFETPTEGQPMTLPDAGEAVPAGPASLPCDHVWTYDGGTGAWQCVFCRIVEWTP